MQASAPENQALPFVATSTARLLSSRLQITHEEAGIAVISGPWGIGKTSTIDAFAKANEGSCAVVKLEQVSKRGTSSVMTLRHITEALRSYWSDSEQEERVTLTGSYWTLRTAVYKQLRAMFDAEDIRSATPPTFTLIFDEAQYLSREAIEMLRYWNDRDRCVTPFPVGLVFVGNNEFALADNGNGNGTSTISGAVRSRALFIDELAYTNITNADLELFAKSRGITEAAAIDTIIGHFSKPKAKRDLRNLERLLGTFRRRAGDGPVTAAIVRTTLGLA